MIVVESMLNISEKYTSYLMKQKKHTLLLHQSKSSPLHTNILTDSFNPYQKYFQSFKHSCPQSSESSFKKALEVSSWLMSYWNIALKKYITVYMLIQ